MRRCAHVCMLNFIREHSRVITKLISYQFGSAFLALALGFAVPSENTALQLCTSIFAILFMVYLNHTVLWEHGAKNRIRVDAGRAKYDPLTGLFIGLVAGIPNIFLGVVVAITRFLALADGPFGWEWAGGVNFLFNWIARLWQGMYLGIIQAVAPGSHYILLLTPLPAILFAFLSYWMGLQNFRMFGIFTLKRPEEKKSGPSVKK